MEGIVAKRFVSCRERRLDTGARHCDEADHSSDRRCLREGEEAVVQANPNLQFSILKAGHHGSRTSSGEALLKLVQPRLAFISCGEHNHYGHPSPETLARLKATGAIIFRTDQDGQIRLRLTTEKLEVTAQLSKRKKELKQ